MRTKALGVMVLLGFAAGMLGCETNAQTGALIGAGGGALAGQAIGGNTEGTLIGTAVGAGLGYIIGNEKDKAIARSTQPPPPPVAVEYPPQPVVVMQAPPTVVVEQRPPYPGRGYVWVDGYWVWTGDSYAWQSGYWAYPPQPTVIWVQPRYERYDRGHRYTPGYWHHRR
jgi:hypothetical protein